MNPSKKIYISFIENFWVAYDSVCSTRDSTKQTEFIQTLYLNKATEGLKAFIKMRKYSASSWTKAILNRKWFA